MRIHQGQKPSLYWWSKSTEECIADMMNKRLRMAHKGCLPKERGKSYMCRRVHTIVIKTVRWRA